MHHRIVIGPPYPAGLNGKEVQLLQALADGLQSRAAYEICGFTPDYGKKILHGIRDKTGMDTTIGAVAWCFRRKVLV